jgi:hypothetical protein
MESEGDIAELGQLSSAEAERLLNEELMKAREMLL